MKKEDLTPSEQKLIELFRTLDRAYQEIAERQLTALADLARWCGMNI